MIRILQRRFLQEIILYFLLTFAIFNLLFLMANLLQLVKKGIDLAHALPILPYILPYSFPFTIPIGLLAAVTLVAGRMVIDNELLIIKSSGIHLSFLCSTVLVFSLVLGMISYTFHSELIPYCYEEMKVGIRNSLYAHFMTGEGRNRTFEVGSTEIYCDAYQKGKFSGLMIFTQQKGRWLKLSARLGRAGVVGKDRNVILTLYEVSISEVNSPDHHLQAKEITFPMELNLGSWEREEFKTTRELWKRADRYKKLLETTPNLTPQKRKEYKRELHETIQVIYDRYTLSLSSFSLTLIALGVSFLFHYTHRLLPLFLSLMVASALFFGPLFGGRILADHQIIPPELGYFIPHIFSILGGSLLLAWAFRK